MLDTERHDREKEESVCVCVALEDCRKEKRTPAWFTACVECMREAAGRLHDEERSRVLRDLLQ